MNEQGKFRILATAYDYRPSLGGVATCAFKTMEALSRIPELELRCLARALPRGSEFDCHGSFETHRVSLHAHAARAVPALARALTKQVVSWRPQAILNFHWLPCAAASYLSTPIRAALHLPYFTFVHGNEIMETDSTPFKRLRHRLSPVKRSIFQNAAGVFAVSHCTAALAELECGVPREKIEVVFNGVDCDAFYPEPPHGGLVEKYGLRGQRVLMTVCRLEDYKGVDQVIAALPMVVKKFPNTIYLVCGEGPDRNRLEALSQQHGVRKNVVFTGAIPFGGLRDYYNLAECFIMPSRVDLNTPNVEGFGIVFLEAAACGKPVIAGNTGGIPDAVENGRNGWLVNPTDNGAIAGAILECFSDPGKASAYGQFGRERAAKSFTWDHTARKIWTRINENVRHRGHRA